MTEPGRSTGALGVRVAGPFLVAAASWGRRRPAGSVARGKIAAMSFNRHLGLVPGDDGSVVLETRPEHEVLPGTIHFAVLATLAEVAAAGAVGAAVVPASVHLSLLRRARPGTLVGRGRVVKEGRRLAVAEGEVEQDGALVATATVHFALVG